MRFVALLLIAGCGHPSGPAWPKQHASDDDGGESLAPRAAAISIAALQDDKPAVAAVVAAPAAAAEAAPAVVAPAVTTPTDETLQTEEIIIEIDE
jgi:hypothetical protein